MRHKVDDQCRMKLLAGRCTGNSCEGTETELAYTQSYLTARIVPANAEMRSNAPLEASTPVVIQIP
jgi:hypothetical protein